MDMAKTKRSGKPKLPTGNIEILPSGGVYFTRRNEDGSEWRRALVPGEFKEAEELLDRDQMRQVREAWTDEVVKKWADEHPPLEGRKGPRPPSPQQEIAALKAMIGKLASGEKLTKKELEALES